MNGREENHELESREKGAADRLSRGEPSAVILDIEVYQEMLERLEDIEDLNMLAEMW